MLQDYKLALRLLLKYPGLTSAVTIDTQNTLTNTPEPRVVHDFLAWRRELRTIDRLGAGDRG